MLGSVTVLDVELGHDAGRGDRAPARRRRVSPRRFREGAGPVGRHRARRSRLRPGRVDRPPRHGRGQDGQALTNFFWWIGHRRTTAEPRRLAEPRCPRTVLRPSTSASSASLPSPVPSGSWTASWSPSRPAWPADRPGPGTPAADRPAWCWRREVGCPCSTSSPSSRSRPGGGLDDAGPCSRSIVLTADSGTELTFRVDDLKEAFVADVASPLPSISASPGDRDQARADPLGVQSEPVNARFEIRLRRRDRAGPQHQLDAEGRRQLSSRRPAPPASAPSCRSGRRPARGHHGDLEALDIKHLVSVSTYYTAARRG